MMFPFVVLRILLNLYIVKLERIILRNTNYFIIVIAIICLYFMILLCIEIFISNCGKISNCEESCIDNVSTIPTKTSIKISGRKIILSDYFRYLKSINSVIRFSCMLSRLIY